MNPTQAMKAHTSKGVTWFLKYEHHAHRNNRRRRSAIAIPDRCLLRPVWDSRATGKYHQTDAQTRLLLNQNCMQFFSLWPKLIDMWELITQEAIQDSKFVQKFIYNDVVRAKWHLWAWYGPMWYNCDLWYKIVLHNALRRIVQYDSNAHINYILVSSKSPCEQSAWALNDRQWCSNKHIIRKYEVHMICKF